MSYKDIVIVCFLTFIFCASFSYAYEVKVGKRYNIFADKKLAGVIDTDYKLYDEINTNNKKCKYNYKITFFQQYLINDNNNLSSIYSSINTAINQKKTSNIPINSQHAILSSLLIHNNILPLEWDFFNYIQLKQENINDLTIKIGFHESPTQKAVLFNFADIVLNFYLSNSGVNFLIFSNLRNTNFISINQVQFHDNELYENIETISKLTILNISQVNNPINRKKSFYKDDPVVLAEDFSDNNELNRSSRVISASEDKAEISNKNAAQKKVNFYKNNIMSPVSNFRDDKDMISIINNYCNTKVEDDYFFILSNEFLAFLNNAILDIDNINLGKKEIMLINSFFPVFIFNEQKKPQINMFNIYVLRLYIEAIADNDNKYFVFHFYPKENFMQLNLSDLHNGDAFDFLTIHVDISGNINYIIFREHKHYIEFILDDVAT